MCKKRRQSAEERLVDEKEALSEGRSSSLFSASQIFRVDRSSESAQKSSGESVLPVATPQFGSCPLSAESPAAILSPSWTSACTSCCTSCQAGPPAPGGPVVSTAAAAAGRHHIPGIARSEWCLEIQRPASVRECLPHRVPLSLWSPASSHFIWVSYLKPMLSALLVLWLHRGANTHSISHTKTTPAHK